ncbi:MAG TPA: LuxR C-terminal-related transcriptional regulator [Gaiellaceae bacterium]
MWLVIDDYQHLADEPTAEWFVDALVAKGNIPLLVTSRVRPVWATAKHLLYGEVAEFGRNVLAMTHEEAARAIRSEKPGALHGLVALAEGWPAVIGLASLVEPPLLVASEDVPNSLHSYFAEELFQGLDQELQWSLAQLSVAPTIDSQLTLSLLGERSNEVLEQGYLTGFLTRDAGSYDLHPLLRQFLRTKFANADSDARETTINAVAASALRRESWDETFALVAEFGLGKLLGDLLTRALDDVLAGGRLATLEQWLDEAYRLIPGEEIVQLVEIELAFRKGRWAETEDKARQLARRVPHHHPLASKALFRAAQVAQLDDRQAESFTLLSEARARSKTQSDLRRALWTRFLTLTDLEEPDLAATALHELEALPQESIEDAIRLSQGPLHLAARWGGVREALERHRGALGLLDRTSDPLVRSGFLQSYGTALVLAGRYEDARECADRQVAEATRSGLDWVRPHGLELKALAQIGMRDFDEAQSGLRTAYKLAENSDDRHAQANASAISARVLLAQGESSRAIQVLERSRFLSAGPGMEGELRSIRALALASLGHLDQATLEVNASAAITSHLEARGLRAYAAVLIALAHTGSGDELSDQLSAALSESAVTGNADSFVASYRVFPDLLSVISNSGLELDEFLLRPVRTYDKGLADKAGLTARQPPVITGEGLTKREEEVLSLIRLGLSNRQIAHTLWIAESTAKAHVRNIFGKLGVRSRTEAALFRNDSDS